MLLAWLTLEPVRILCYFEVQLVLLAQPFRWLVRILCFLEVHAVAIWYAAHDRTLSNYWILIPVAQPVFEPV